MWISHRYVILLAMNFRDYLKKRPLSYSSINSFEYNPESWYRSYILGEKQQSKQMDFGSIVDKRIQEDPTFIPDLPRYPHMQWEGKVIFSDIPLIGKADGVDFDNKILSDYKTGVVEWNKKRADETEQLTMYALLVYVTKKLKPEDFVYKIHWLPTKETGDFKIAFRDDPVVPITFDTKRTMKDIAVFGNKIKKTVEEMERFIKSKE